MFNKQRNNIARFLHSLIHYFFITAGLGSERFLFKILLYNIEQHINQNVQNRTDMIFKRQKQEKNVKNGQHTRIWVQVFLWEIKVKTKLTWAVYVTKSLTMWQNSIQSQFVMNTLWRSEKEKKSRLKISNIDMVAENLFEVHYIHYIHTLSCLCLARTTTTLTTFIIYIQLNRILTFSSTMASGKKKNGT